MDGRHGDDVHTPDAAADGDSGFTGWADEHGDGLSRRPVRPEHREQQRQRHRDADVGVAQAWAPAKSRIAPLMRPVAIARLRSIPTRPVSWASTIRYRSEGFG